jgi:hypothetical protein
MQLTTPPIHYKEWFKSSDSAGFRWLFPSEASLGHFIRSRNRALISAGLIEAVPTRGYFIRTEKFTEEAVKPFFILGKYVNVNDDENGAGKIS